uniref:NADH dehydrogenase subunit 6 n=1 Tax=Colposcenia aliena TaxID=3101724 RepID=A0AAU8G7B5_9HEMI
MMKILFMVMMVNSWVMSSFSYPLFLGFMIIMQTLALCSMVRMMNSSSWLTMTILLIMLGGLMIIFLYTTSISSNKFMIKKQLLYKYFIMIILWFPITNMIIESFFLESLSFMDNFNKEYFKMYSYINFHPSMFMFFYLLLALIIMIKMMKLPKGPMRKKY